jgi:hypothetical protein
MLALAALRWAFFFMLALAYFVHGWGRGPLFPIAFLLELATGLGGYFSDFKTVFFVTVLCASHPASGFVQNAARLGVMVVLTVTLGMVWTAVKGEYRTFVSGGRRSRSSPSTT